MGAPLAGSDAARKARQPISICFFDGNDQHDSSYRGKLFRTDDAALPGSLITDMLIPWPIEDARITAYSIYLASAPTAGTVGFCTSAGVDENTPSTISTTWGSTTPQTFALNPIGGVDTTPDAFTFTDVTNAALSTVQTSNTITVAGLGSGVTVTASVTGGELQKNGGSWGTASVSVGNGDTLKVRHTSSASNSTAVNTVLTIGGVSDTFTSTTVAAAAGVTFFTGAAPSDDRDSGITLSNGDLTATFTGDGSAYQFLMLSAESAKASGVSSLIFTVTDDAGDGDWSMGLCDGSFDVDASPFTPWHVGAGFGLLYLVSGHLVIYEDAGATDLGVISNDAGDQYRFDRTVATGAIEVFRKPAATGVWASLGVSAANHPTYTTGGAGTKYGTVITVDPTNY